MFFRWTATLEALRQVGRQVQQTWRQATWRGQPSRTQTQPPPLGVQVQPLGVQVPQDELQQPWQRRGHAAYHLPSRIRWAQSRAARRSRAGRFYLTVPLRLGGRYTLPVPLRPGGRYTRHVSLRSGAVIFRTITPSSQGWWIPARPAQPAPRADQSGAGLPPDTSLTPPQTQQIAAAVQQDVEALLVQALGRV